MQPLSDANAEPQPEGPPLLTFAFEARVDVAPPRDLGLTPQGRRRIVPILGGTFAGKRLRGHVLPGFDDQFVRGDGVLVVQAYYALEIDDGTVVSIVNRGLRRGPPEVMQRLLAGERVDPALYYFRTVTEFSVGAGPHDWLNRSIFVCAAERLASTVILRFFEVL
jgi:hypothetical protein